MITESENPTSDDHNPGSRIQDPGEGIRTVGVIGEGKMGTSIFYSLIDLPYSLRWIGSEDADPGKLELSFRKKICRALKTGLTSQEQHDHILGNTTISSNLKDVFDCDLIIEAIPEELMAKQKLFNLLDSIAKPSCILSSNSSSIKPSKLFTGTDRDERIIGIHYFYPVPLKEVVELIITARTDLGVREDISTFLRNSNKQILELDEHNSFILNRLFLDIQNESFKIIEQGKATEEQIDLLVKANLFPVGIFDFMDNVGIDTMLTAVQNYISDYPHKDYYLGLVTRLRELVAGGKMGKKSGHGFYLYKDGQQVISDSSGKLPENRISEIIGFLKFTYLNTAKRFIMQSGCTVGEMNLAIREYFGLEKGPFE